MDARNTFLQHVPVLADSFKYKNPPPSFRDTALEVFKCFFQDSIPEPDLYTLIAKAFPFKVPVFPIDPRTYMLDLTHGSGGFCTDFGARMTAQLVEYFYQQNGLPLHVLYAGHASEILSLTHAFAELKDIHSTFLYPAGEISSGIEPLFSSLPANIHVFKINGTLADAQAMVQTIENDTDISRALDLFVPDAAQISYLLSYTCCCIYAALTVLSRAGYDNNIEQPRLIFGIPLRISSGLSAAVLAKKMNAPITGFLTTIDPVYQSPESEYPKEYAMLNLLYQTDSPAAARQDIALHRFDQHTQLAAIRSCNDRTGYLISPAAAELWHVWNKVRNGADSDLPANTATDSRLEEYPAWLTGAAAAQSCISIIIEPSHPCFYTDAIKTATGREPSVPHRFECNLMPLQEPAEMSTAPADLKDWLFSLL